MSADSPIPTGLKNAAIFTEKRQIVSQDGVTKAGRKFIERDRLIGRGFPDFLD
jgi:hypothetical protein